MSKTFRVLQSALVSGGLTLAFFCAPVFAGTTTTSFQVGIRIGPPVAKKASVPKRLRYTCGAAASVLSVAGYRNPVSLKCSGSAYAFRATRYGKTTTVSFNAATGKIIP